MNGFTAYTGESQNPFAGISMEAPTFTPTPRTTPAAGVNPFDLYKGATSSVAAGMAAMPQDSGGGDGGGGGSAVSSPSPSAPGGLAAEGLGRALGYTALGPTGPLGFAGLLGSMALQDYRSPGAPYKSFAEKVMGPMSPALAKEFQDYTAKLAQAYNESVRSGNVTPERAFFDAINDLNTAGRLGDVLGAIDRGAQGLGISDPRDATPAPAGGPSYSPGSVTSESLGASGSGGGGMGYGSDAQGAAEAGGYGGSGMYAKGGLINMRDVAAYLQRGYAKGGYVPGSSGGMEDDVPAVIDGNRPARLSSGEFVFDAATVAAAGDGNNSAGAKKLNGLRHAIRKKAYGHKKQPPKNYSLGDLVDMT